MVSWDSVSTCLGVPADEVEGTGGCGSGRLVKGAGSGLLLWLLQNNDKEDLRESDLLKIRHK